MKDIRFDTSEMRKDRSEALCAWVSSFGVDPKDVRSRGLITRGESSYQLHLSKVARNDAGNWMVDLAIDDVVSEPLVIDIGTERSWPAWLNEDDTDSR